MYLLQNGYPFLCLSMMMTSLSAEYPFWLRKGPTTASYGVELSNPNRGTDSVILTSNFILSQLFLDPLKFLLKMSPIMILQYWTGTPLHKSRKTS